jgi:predicted ester cyclase
MDTMSSSSKGGFMTNEQMKRLYLEHRALEEARDLDGVVDTFDDDCFLENVALGSKVLGRDGVRSGYESLFRAFPDLSPDSRGEAYGDDLFVTWGVVRGTMEGPWQGIAPTGRSFECAFFNVVPFRNGKMQGESILFDLPALCAGAGLRVDDLIAAVAAGRA